MKKLLITGQMRSGTTLITNLINSQPRCVCYADLGGIIFRCMSQTLPPSFHSALTPAQRHAIMEVVRPRFMELSGEWPRFDAGDFTTCSEVIDLVLRSIANHDTLIAGIKVTRAEEHIAQLLQETDVHVIHIYRDPRDVILSTKNYNNLNPDLYAFAIRWREGLRAALSLRHERLLNIRYEDLAMQQPETTKALDSYLGTQIQYDLRVLQHGTREWQNDSSFGDLTKLIDTTPVGRWRRHHDSAIPCVYTLCEKQVLDLGYAPMEVPLITRQLYHFIAGLKRLNWTIRRLVKGRA